MEHAGFEQRPVSQVLNVGTTEVFPLVAARPKRPCAFKQVASGEVMMEASVDWHLEEILLHKKEDGAGSERGSGSGRSESGKRSVTGHGHADQEKD